MLAKDLSVEYNQYRSFTGNYFVVLGWLSLISTIISVAMVYWTDYLHLDMTFFIWFGIGAGLKQGSATARKWAIAIFILVTLLTVLCLFPVNAKANIGHLRIDQTDPAFYVILGVTWLVFAVPGIMLLTNRGRLAFTKIQGEQAAPRNR
jgi:hypothetical protein